MLATEVSIASTSIQQTVEAEMTMTPLPTAPPTEVPTLTPTDKYLWHYLTIGFNDTSSVDTTPAITGVYGDTGQDWQEHGMSLLQIRQMMLERHLLY